MINFDHIAIGCATREQGAEYINSRTGLTVPVGGEHPLMGTHNLVMSTGKDSFLEVIAINPDAAKPAHPRWFGLDSARFDTPRPHAWILNSDDLDKDLEIARANGVDLGAPLTLTRGDMTWRFAVRKDGAIPLDGAAPMIMQWPEMPEHPATNMPDFGARILHVEVQTPHATKLESMLAAIGGDIPLVSIGHFDETKLTFTLALKDGREVVLD